MKKADYRGLERHIRKVEAMPEKKEEYKGFYIYVSDGGPYTDKRMSNEYPNGWYESSYWIGTGEKVAAGQVLVFDFLHDLNMSNESRKQARIESALHAAKIFIDEWQKEVHGASFH